MRGCLQPAHVGVVEAAVGAVGAGVPGAVVGATTPTLLVLGFDRRASLAAFSLPRCRTPAQYLFGSILRILNSATPYLLCVVCN